MNPSIVNLASYYGPVLPYLGILFLAAVPLCIMALRTRKGMICYIACVPFILIILVLMMQNCTLQASCKGPKLPPANSFSLPQVKQ
jgi:uncharacterized membrane protein YoaK (UPF0700 family)